MKPLNQRLVEFMGNVLNLNVPVPTALALDAAKLERDVQEPQNLVVFRVVYLPMSAILPARIRIYSERFRQYIHISPNDAKFDNCNGNHEMAIVELKERGFNVVAFGEGPVGMYVMSDTFEPFKR